MPLPPTPATRRRVCASLAAFSTLPAWAQFRVEISGVGATQLPVAIARFRDEDKAGPNAAIGAMADRVVTIADGRIARIDVNERRAAPSEVSW